ncbi:toll/interleukin-1 receptor domain-containing protein [Streptomyces sp. NPDC004267]|uniref:toll/interleukin-1 receptor domain-containing protein n=1 Tax=Streptomyces sp. NPDC004267 TaxID=3364694 RepID=UPI0036BD45DC
MSEIFLNYRTGDGNETAALLDQALKTRFGEDAVFFAGNSIRPGEPFPPALLTHVRRCEVLLAVIGPDWAGHPALRKETDWVRTELLEARRCGVHIVPVLKGRRMERLDAGTLPPELEWLADLNSLRVDSQSHQRDVRTIGDEVAQLVPRLAERDSQAGQTAAEERQQGRTHNSVSGGNSGFSLQSGEVGQIGTIITGPTGPVHTGSGTQNNHTHRPHLSGDGAAYVAGDNHGGISHRFGRTERDEADGR